ncbi:MAG: phosphatidylserine decarboxylase [Alphaproteobacteria bacterium]|nr:phosphatidylserine decarboxylase [Alphaproteobacteria bacterium]
MFETIRSAISPVHRAGWPFIIASGAATVLAYGLVPRIGNLFALVTAWMVYFFRDPDRVTPTRPALVVSPADGRIQLIVEAPPPPELGLGSDPRPRISVFLNVFDVHVNRLPVDGSVSAAHYRPGKFLNASLDKASEDNERMSLAIALPDGRDIAVVQIAGLIARRILCDVGAGASARAGARFGLIRFGSRVDVYLPVGVAPLVVVGQRVIGGESVLADLNGQEPARAGEVR